MPGRGIFGQALANIKTAKRIREEGGVNSIPFGLPTLDRHVPGIMKGLQYIVTASSGVKSKMNLKLLLSILTCIFVV